MSWKCTCWISPVRILIHVLEPVHARTEVIEVEHQAEARMRRVARHFQAVNSVDMYGDERMNSTLHVMLNVLAISPTALMCLGHDL